MVNTPDFKSDRRDFLKTGAFLSCLNCLHLPGLISLLNEPLKTSAAADLPVHRDLAGLELPLHEAMFYSKMPDNMVQCDLCPRQCKVAKQERGYCGVKVNYHGTYYTLVHSRPCSINLDPVEKKPLYHFLPTTTTFSLATAGCNMMCKYCQNWQISQVRPEQVKNYPLTPQRVIDVCRERNAQSVAFTYSEPVVFYEYMFDIAKAGAEQGVKSIMISNGFINKKPMQELGKYLTAVKIDFKGFTDKFYREVCAGQLQPVLENLQTLRALNVWLELVYLMIPTLNDDLTEIDKMCRWIVKELGPDVPLHFSRFHPHYQLANIPPTPVSQMDKARSIAREEGIHYVYVGNVTRHEGSHTYCPQCKNLLIERQGYFVSHNKLVIKDGKGYCPSCQTTIPGIWV